VTAEERRIKELQYAALVDSIVKAKILYYQPREISEATITALMPKDSRYDGMERSYLRLCRELGKPNELVHKEYPGVPEHLNGKGMMEVDWEHPVVKAAYAELLQYDRRKK